MQTPTDAPPLSDLATIADLVREHPNFLTEPTLRWQLRHRDANGLADCCVRVGRKILIYRSRYASWLAARAGA